VTVHALTLTMCHYAIFTKQTHLQTTTTELQPDQWTPILMKIKVIITTVISSRI